MEAVIFTGIQASGKTTFYKETFFPTHVRISLDQLKIRYREDKFCELCLQAQQAFVIDNTNPTIADRRKYIEAAKARKFKVVGYYFQSELAEAIARNNTRLGKAKIPEIGIKGTRKKMELPSFQEGFDQLYIVEIANESFRVQELENEIR